MTPVLDGFSLRGGGVGQALTLADAEPDPMDEPEPRSEKTCPSSRLTEADNAFFLGLYRNAVSLYQPKIEKRTGVRLGEICVRDYRQLDHDVVQNLHATNHPRLFRLLKWPVVRSHLRQWRASLESTHAERARGCMAAYYANAIYVSFAVDIRCHEEHVGMTAVHELSHALWERIEGVPLHKQRFARQMDWDRFRLMVEGYATYAERVWFVDMYPPSVKRAVPYMAWNRAGDHFRGMQRISELVRQSGPQILLRIPRQWGIL